MVERVHPFILNLVNSEIMQGIDVGNQSELVMLSKF